MFAFELSEPYCFIALLRSESWTIVSINKGRNWPDVLDVLTSLVKSTAVLTDGFRHGVVVRKESGRKKDQISGLKSTIGP